MPHVDPFQAFLFRVEVDGFDGEIGFTRVSGLNEETEVVPYRVGSDPMKMRKLRGLTDFGNITLERGLDPNGIFRLWRNLVANSELEHETGASMDNVRRTTTITLKDAEGRDVYRWEIFRAWPPVRNVEDLDASSSDVLLENVELAHEGILETPLVQP